MSMESKELFVNKRAESGFLQNICRFWPADSWCVSKKVEADFNPVSYTHLDVYKRQVVLLLWSLLKGGKGSDTKPAVSGAASTGTSASSTANSCLLYTSRCV